MTRVVVGRDRPLALIGDAVDSACAGRGGMVVVAGEAGIGKTVLLAAASADATAKGVLAIGGTCWDGDGAPGCWPWIQVVRGLERLTDPDDWLALRRAAGDGLTRLLGQVPASTVNEASTAHEASAGADFLLLDSVMTLLVTAARRGPLLVVLDDLQWADPASVRMLDFVARHAAGAAVLVLAAYRESEAGTVASPLASLLARATAGATVVPLAGLGDTAVGELVARAAGRTADADVVAEIRRRTGGNPFFVQQVASLWGATGSLAGLPPGVRDTVERRLALLAPQCATLLRTAALLGPEFDVAMTAAASAMTTADARRALEDAVMARLVGPADHGRARFVHDLVRETLLQSLSEQTTRDGHAAIVRAAQHPQAPAGWLPPGLLANHAYLAVPAIEPATAVTLLLAAGRDAAGRAAAQEACGHLAKAQELITRHGLPGWEHVTVELGVARQRAGDLEAARQCFTEAVSAARERDDAESFARGVLGLRSLGHLFSDEPADFLRLVSEARVRLDTARPGGSPLLAMIMAAESQALSHAMAGEREAGERLSADAVALARRFGDAEALGFCLLARHDAIWRAGTARERLALADEMKAVARKAPDRDLALQASLLRTVALIEAGDQRGLAEHQDFVALAEQARLPRYRYLALSRQAAVATMQGRFAQARRQIDEARELGRQIGEVDADGVWHDQICEVARLEGRADEIDQLIADDRASGNPLGVVVTAMRAVDAGDSQTARTCELAFAELAGRWPRWAGFMWLAYRAQLAAVCADPWLSAEVRAGIAPVSGDWAVLGGAVVIHGPMSHWLATIDAAEHRWDEAIGGFGRAQQLADRMQARPWSVLARLGAAGALAGRGQPGDADAALALLDVVGAQAAELGLAPAQTQASDLIARLRDVTQSPVNGPQALGAFRFDGAVWTLSFGGQTALLPDAKGLHDLHQLLANPGAEIAAATLLDSSGGALATATRAFGADAVLDERAKAQYHARITSLDGQLDAAVARGDDDEADRLEAERGALIGELGRAFGLGGRPRLLGDEAERARKTVTARIRDVLRRLDARHPSLAAYLRRAVSTGTYCSYRPAHPVSWDLGRAGPFP